jgi:hypothetical protein
MPLNKYATWGAEPLTAQRPPGLGAIMRNGFGVMNLTLQKGLPGPTPAPVPSPAPSPGVLVPTPSTRGLRVVWSLGAVRDALTDQSRPTLEKCNQQIEVHLNSAAVRDVGDLLKQEYVDLYDPYLLQFRPLQSEAAGFDLERRERLAELAAVELEIMATVEDLTPTASQPASAKRARKQP